MSQIVDIIKITNPFTDLWFDIKHQEQTGNQGPLPEQLLNGLRCKSKEYSQDQHAKCQQAHHVCKQDCTMILPSQPRPFNSCWVMEKTVITYVHNFYQLLDIKGTYKNFQTTRTYRPQDNVLPHSKSWYAHTRKRKVWLESMPYEGPVIPNCMLNSMSG